eukprot:TRINITY_DN11610_c0_g1_i1.p1 TRINITY_DN11610_c0_g1~~TRINITY_DN11610_c0_g1_i1.p1  ORF type:complete len:380 (+),score=37.36 TRINITY_DN11610_c0_g1_i1:114-1253(+)
MKRQFVFAIIAIVVVWTVVVSASMIRMSGVENRVGAQVAVSPIDSWDEGWGKANEKKRAKSQKRDTPTTSPPPTKQQTDQTVEVEKKATKAIPDEHLLKTQPVNLTDTSILDKCPHSFTDSDHNQKWTDKLTRFFYENNIHWWLDEGGLIGSSRAGGMSNADDDYDFFALLPNQRNPCRPDTPSCTKEEFNSMIHAFLLKLWNFGFCINNFDPDPTKFDSKSKLMYSLMMNQNRIYQPGAKTPGARCFEHGKSPRFAHMHLALLTEDGKLATNLWAPLLKNGGHAHDFIPLSVVLPTTRCRVGPVEAPCPQNVVKFLKIRNEGEYAKTSSQGNCLIVRRKWSIEKKEKIIELTRNLHECGYNSMYELIEPAIKSNYMNC